MSARLTAALALLIPGDARFPRAATLDLTRFIVDEPRFAGAVAAVLDAAEGLEAMDAEAGTALLRTLEGRLPEACGTLVVAAYSAYYTHPEVLTAVEAATGYKAGPPQPGGYALTPFDPAVLAVPAARAPSWRDPG